MDGFEDFKKQIEERLNKGEEAENIINEQKSKVGRILAATIIAEISPEKLIGEVLAVPFQEVYTFLTKVLGIEPELAEKGTIYIWYLIYSLDKETGAALINSISNYLLTHKILPQIGQENEVGGENR